MIAIFLAAGFVITFKLVRLCFQYRLQIGEMGGMVFAMALSMVNGLLVGEIASRWLDGQLFNATLTGVAAGSGIGVVVALPFGLLALLEGTLSGAMGGMMGVMLGSMLPGAGTSALAVLMLLQASTLLLLFLYIRRRVRLLPARGKKHYWLHRLKWYLRVRLFR